MSVHGILIGETKKKSKKLFNNFYYNFVLCKPNQLFVIV